MFITDLLSLHSSLHVGTSSFSCRDWRGVFYPPDAAPAEFLGHYATVFHTVEIDATWHAMPSRRTVESWARRVPDGFTFSLKVPKEITHDRYLEDCGAPWSQFLRVLEPLGDKRGPLLFQFPYVAKKKDAEEHATGADFRRRLAAFAPLLPPEGRYVVEVRNAGWLREPLLDVLRERGIGLALVSYYTMPPPQQLLRHGIPLTATFGYVRFLGHHTKMDELVRNARVERGKEKDWDELLVDRTPEMIQWVPYVMELAARHRDVFVYFNNHFAGFAPGSIELFARVLGQYSGGTAL
ncbi:DUF72 domain-containing protein [Candidatus Fermentibacteria bacterium]|nr:DUF72 domain-containing protein [Candidatus Fermentibacteria bacterium]